MIMVYPLGEVLAMGCTIVHHPDGSVTITLPENGHRAIVGEGPTPIKAAVAFLVAKAASEKEEASVG